MDQFYECMECHKYDTYHVFYNDGWSIDRLCMECKDQGKRLVKQAIAEHQALGARLKAAKAAKDRALCAILADQLETALARTARLRRYYGYNRIRLNTDPAKRVPFASRQEAD